jgi:PAS domain S-box-containing protein
VLGLGAAVALVEFHVLGTALASRVEDLHGGLAALAAAAVCALLARRSSGKIRLGWSLIALSAAMSGVGTAVAIAVGLFTGQPETPFPSAADAPYLLGQALTIAGILVFPSAPSRTTNRSRAIIDGAVIAISLLYLAWVFGLGDLYNRSGVGPPAELIGLAYPVSDIVAISVLLLTMRRAARVKSGRLRLLLAGLVAKLVSDGVFAVVSVHAGVETNSGLIDIAALSGYMLIALAALWPVHPAGAGADTKPTSLWGMAMPWAGMVTVMLTVVVLGVMGRQLDIFLLYPGAALVMLLMVSQLLSYKDSLMFLNQSRQAEAALASRTQLLHEVIELAPLGIARLAADNTILEANAELGTLLHASRTILIGSSIRAWVAPVDLNRVGETVDHVISEGLDFPQLEGPMRRADGSIVWMSRNVSVVRKRDGTVDYMMVMFQDETAKHEAEGNSLAALASLERLNLMKSEFVSMVSHEFRTALVGIQGFSELIRDEDLEVPDIKALAGDINNDAMRLNRMISEMLDLDRMEAGKIRLELKPLSVNQLLKDAVERTQVGTDRHTVVAELDMALPVTAGDSDRLVQVISNLLSNALKYSPDGGEIKVTSRNEDGLIHVSVQDHGQGIPAEFIDRVFGRYERFESNRTSKVTGTGLGLAISKQIVDLHGGTIWVESVFGKGSTFHFTLPVKAVSGAGNVDVRVA